MRVQIPCRDNFLNRDQECRPVKSKNEGKQSGAAWCNAGNTAAVVPQLSYTHLLELIVLVLFQT